MMAISFSRSVGFSYPFVCVWGVVWFLLSQAKLSIHFLFWVLDSLGLRVSCWVLLGFVAV